MSSTTTPSTFLTIESIGLSKEKLAGAPFKVQEAFDLLFRFNSNSILSIVEAAKSLHQSSVQLLAPKPPQPTDPKLLNIFTKMPETVRDFIGEWKFADESLLFPAVKDTVVVPTKVPNGHDYELEVPVQFISNGDKHCLRFGSKTETGNNMTLQRDSVRAPILEEVVALLCARNSKNGTW
jgi:hypothetical protein